MNDSKHKGPGCAACGTSRRGISWLLLIAAALIVVAVWPRRKAGEPPAPTAAVLATNALAVPTEARADLQFLKGRWIRPDGGYILEIRQVDADGQLDAGYFNPNPIRVVSSKATKEGAAVKVYVELNDVNYPGCKYNLTYLADQRMLVGTYFQAAMQQTYEVAFEREQ
jgi:hypothetical protein